MSEGWTNTHGDGQFSSRNFNNSNFRGQRREGGYGRPNFNTNGFGGGARGYVQNGGGRPFYSGQPRQPRNQFGGQQRVGGSGYNNFAASGTSSKIDIESNKVGMVIGRGGGKIREIQDSFNVHVKIDRDPGANGLTGVTIHGEQASIEQAKCFIQDLVAVK